MKPLNVVYNGKPLRKIYPHATAWQVFKYRLAKFVRKVLFVCFVISTGYGLYWLGGVLNPAVVYTKAEVIKQVDTPSPVLERIAKCESGNNHWKNGQVLVNGNDNHSVDIGVFQINNKVWGTKATELGYNLMIEKDNRDFAQYLYKNYGTEPWVWTKKCWN